MTHNGPAKFEEAWALVADRVKAYCLKLARNAEIADVAYAATASRAWRGFASFRGDSSFQTFATTIAQREVYRAMRNQKRWRAVASHDLGDDAERVCDLRPEVGTCPARLVDWSNAIEPAAALGYLSASQASVLAMRFRRPSASWAELGTDLGIDASSAAVHHCRGIQCLRVYAIINEPTLVGGLDVLRDALEVASRDLTVHETRAFETIVLRGSPTPLTPSRVGRELRAICSKVASCIALSHRK
jgi:DNA-directed RNA polymerase specialized sigma24 family protein